jgi:8-oxo-dGTP diphosphatase
MANKITGLGGKIEPGESLMESAKRELFEESGLTIDNPEFRGTFQWIDESNRICMTHIIFATQFWGELQEENREGFLSWYLIGKLNELTELAEYQRKFLEFLLKNPDSFYSGIAEFRNEEIVDYVDTIR